MDYAVSKSLHGLIINYCMYMYVYEYLRAMFGHEGKRIYPSVRVRGILYLPGTEADEYPVELKRSKPPSCCGRWVLHDKQASLSCSTGSPFRWWRNRTRVPPCPPRKCTHVNLCMCAWVFMRVCLCAQTKLFNLSQSLRFAWFWQLLRLSFEGDITQRILHSSVHIMWVKLQNVCVLHICWQLYVRFQRETSEQDGKCIWTYIT